MYIGILVPIFGIIFGCGIALLAIWTEYGRDRTLIERGLYQPKQPKTLGPPGWGFLLAGSIVAGISMALVVSAFVFQIGRLTGTPGLIFLFVSIALIVVHSLTRWERVVPKG